MVILLDKLVIAAYFILMLSLGLYFARRQEGSETFFLADRKLNAFHVAGTAFSTFIGSGFAFVLATFGYKHGVSSLWLVGALVAGFLIFAAISPRIKEMSDTSEAITLPFLLHHEWGRRTTVLASLVTIGIFTLALGVQFLVAGNILRIAFDVSLNVAAGGFAALVIGYTLLGGFLSVTWSDIVQMVIVVGTTLLILLPLAWKEAGGIAGLRGLPQGHLDLFGMAPTMVVGLGLVGFFLFFGSQDVFQRVYAAQDAKTARRGMALFGLGFGIMAVVWLVIGMLARALFADIRPDAAIPVLIENTVPVGLVGLTLAGYLALANSTADGQLLTVSSNVMHDFYEVMSERDITDARMVRYNRGAVVVIGVIGLAVAVAVPSIADVIFQMASLFGILGIVVILTMFWERTTPKASFTGMFGGLIAGGLVALAASNLQAAPLAGVVTAAVLTVSVSLVERSATT